MIANIDVFVFWIDRLIGTIIYGCFVINVLLSRILYYILIRLINFHTS